MGVYILHNRSCKCKLIASEPADFVTVDNITSLNTMHCGGEPELYTECTIYALILPHSPGDIIHYYTKARVYAEGSHKHILDYAVLSNL